MSVGDKSDIPEGFHPGMRAPEIESYAFQANEFKEFSLSSLLGKPVMLIFYPMDFGYIAPSELTLVQKLMQDEQIVAISTGSVLSKYSWAMTSQHKGGIQVAFVQ